MITLWRVYNVSENRYFNGHNGRTTWTFKHHAVEAFKNRNKMVSPDDHPDWKAIEYKLVEVE
jgi:hypothetical protein